MKPITGFLIALTVAYTTSHNMTCRIYLDPGLGGSRADCRGLHLTKVPGDLPSNTVSLDLSDNHVTVLMSRAFVHIPRLLTLVISHSRVSRLEPRAFEGLTNLRSLNLNYNHLQLDNDTYPQDIFRPLERLTDLNLGYNSCRLRGTTPHWIFKWLTNLETLKIDTFEDDIFGSGFGYLKNLTTLNIGTGDKDECTYCAIDVIHNHTFSAFENSTLKVLIASDCHLHSVEAGAFSPLKSISKIVFDSVKYLPSSIALRAFYGLTGKHVSKVLLPSSYTSVYSLQDLTGQLISNGILSKLTDICIDHIDLSSNTIIYIDYNFLKVFSKCLKFLDISNNKLLGNQMLFLQMRMCEQLQHLDVSHQQKYNKHENTHTLVHRFLTANLHSEGYHREDTSNFSWNKVLPLNEVTVYFPPNLRICNLSEMAGRFGRFFITQVVGASHLKLLNLANNGMWGLWKTIGGLTALQYLDLSGNEGHGMTKDFIQSFPNLTYLSLNNMGLDKNTLLEGEPVLEGLKTINGLRHFEIVGNHIQWMDMRYLTTLTVLNISRNSLVSIPFKQNDLPFLSVLDLSLNAITYFDDDTMEMLEILGQRNKLILKLDGNPLSCSCQSLMFIQWMFTSSVTFDRNATYSCVTEYAVFTTTHRVYQDFNYHWTSCQGRFWLPVSISLMFLIALLLVSAVLVSSNWTKIENFILVLMGRGVQRVSRQDFRKDAYVAHSDQEIQFVMDALRRALEDTHGLRLILPERDFLLGGFVADHVVESINKSWKTILVVSDDFLDDPWSYFIMKSTTYYVSNMNPNRLILMVLGDVNRGQLPDLLLSVTAEEDIIQMDDLPDHNDKVWLTVRDRILAPA
ncbi:toll-like receptor 4 [Haliotis rubra]|uniref:toll-like receptor 4 n=1 Tax=Haliotis rubra TaxID=36100 RepID=UPI001EE54E72|nr:toll-like receptor 4 [Haliotis rubra]